MKGEKNMSNQDVRERLITVVNSRGVKQQYFVDRLDISKTYLSLFKNSKANLSKSKLAQLDNLLKLFEN